MKCYLIAGESYKLVNDEVNKIINDSLNVIKYDLRQDKLIDVINEANYASLIEDTKYIIVRADNIFKKKKNDEENNDSVDKDSEDIKIFSKYMDNPKDNVIIIFTSLQLPDKRKKLFKLIEKKGIVNIIPTLNKKELSYKCIEILKQKEYIANYEVASYIVDNSYVNYDIMTNELEKIYILLKPCTLNISKIENIISQSIQNNTYNYIDAIIKSDLKSASLYSKNFPTLKIDPIVIIIMLAKEFEIYYMLLNHTNAKNIQALFHKEDWQMNNYLQNKKYLDINKVKKIIIKLNDYDYKYKSGLIDKNVLIDLLSIDLCDIN